MRYLGLDLGTRTLGIAISDATGLVARTYQIVRFDEKNYEKTIPILKEIIEKENVQKIILGFPKNMNNTIGERCEETLSYKKLVEEKIDIPIEMQDERLSTIEATNIMIQADLSRKKRKNKVDALAATIILQSYLDKRKGE